MKRDQMPDMIITETPNSKERFNLAHGLKRAFKAFYMSTHMLQNIKVAIPSVLFLALQLGVLALYLASLDGPMTSFWAIFIKGISPADFGHFPGHIIFMQPVLERFGILLDIIVNIIFQGATVFLVSAAWSGNTLSIFDGFRTSFKNYLRLLLVALAVSTAIFLSLKLARNISGNLQGIPGIAVYTSGILAALLFQALFLFSIPIIILRGSGCMKAIAGSFRVMWEFASTTFLLVLIPFILTLPTTFISLKAELIIAQLSPDFIVYNNVIASTMEMAATYLMISGATIIYLQKIGKKRG